MFVELNETEQKLSIFLAKKRYASNRNSNVTDKKIGPQSVEDTDLEGVAAEVAFCKAMNIYPDTEINHHPDYDALFKGKKIDIKTTKHRNGLLLATLNKVYKDIDIYVLVVGNFPKYNLVGFLETKEFLLDRNKVNLGYGTCYGVPQDMLKNINLLNRSRE